MVAAALTPAPREGLRGALADGRRVDRRSQERQPVRDGGVEDAGARAGQRQLVRDGAAGARAGATGWPAVTEMRGNEGIR